MRRAFEWLFLSALALRLAIATRSLPVVDRWFVPDDTYYTLSIARSLAAGQGPSVDGVVQTSGFQPLLAFMLVPVFWLQQHPDAALRAAIVLMAVADAVAAWLLGKVTERFAGRQAGLTATAIWAVSPIAIANALGGLETALALALSLGLVLASLSAWQTEETRATGLGAFVPVGLLSGACLLARVDTVFLVGLVGLMHLRARQLRGLAVAVVCASVVVAPWWLYLWNHFGTVVPESGAAVAQIVEIHRAIHLQSAAELGWTTGTLLGSPFVELQRLRDFLYGHSELASGSFVVVVAALAILGARLPAFRAAPAPIAALSLYAAAIAVFYTFHLPALWFFRRYFAPCHAWLAVLWAVALWQAWERRASLRAVWPLALLLVAAGTVTSVYEAGRMLWVTPSVPPDQMLHGTKGYRHAAQAVWKLLPERGVLGSFQSGALAYYARPGWTVVNLDGVVDHDAFVATGELKLADYAERRGMTHYADWPFNTDVFQLTSAHAVYKIGLRRIAAIQSQGQSEFWVYEAETPR